MKEFLIRKRLSSSSNLVKKACAGMLAGSRALHQLASYRPGTGRILLIFGCQRSGTTMLSQIFEGDFRVRSYAEHSQRLARAGSRYRLDTLDRTRIRFARDRSELTVAKPLVESQRATELLDYFDGAMGLWMFRQFRDVASSYVKLFDRVGVNILRRVVQGQEHWSTEKISDTTRETVCSLFEEEMSPYDAAAIFWWMRNQLFYEQQLSADTRVRMCRYEDLVTEPRSAVPEIYDFVGMTYPGDYLVSGIHARSRGKGKTVVLSDRVERLCAEMWEKLLGSYHARGETPADGSATEPETADIQIVTEGR